MERTEIVFKALLAFILVLAFNGLILAILLLVEFDGETKKLIAMSAVGTDGAALTTAIGYWLGSSSSGQRKDQVIANLAAAPPPEQTKP